MSTLGFSLPRRTLLSLITITSTVVRANVIRDYGMLSHRAAEPTLPAGWSYSGCYTTLRYGQAVPGGSTNMTVENCVAVCISTGYNIAGVEYAGECYCDNAFSNGGGPAPDGEAGCSMACNGDSTQKCGGSDRLNVYTDSKSVPTGAPSTSRSATPSSTRATATATPTPTSGVNETAILPFKYQGCYTDNGSGGRTLSNAHQGVQDLTVESCIKICSADGYTIAGMQYANECYCDNYLRNSPSKVDDSDCSMSCAGNANEKCGAGSRNSIYSNGTMLNYTLPAPKTDGLPGNFKYVGCLQDNINNQRTFPYQLNFPDNNTNVGCLKLCQQFGYEAGGTEYGAQCFCGDVQDVINSGAQMLANSSCDVRCANDTAGSNGGEICGGQNAISYYKWSGTPMNSWTFATGNAAGAYEFLIGGVVIPLITSPARNGKVTFLEKFGTGPPNSTGAYELDLAFLGDFSKAWREMHVKTDIFCAAGLTLPDRAGRQIDVGGWSHPSTEGLRLYWPDGRPGVPGTNDWQENVDEVHLLEGRWYPTAMGLANGSILVMGGEEGSNGFPVPSLEVVPSPSGQVLFAEYLNRTDPYNLYPFLMVLPSGKIFVGYYNEAKLLDPVSLQPVKDLPKMPGAVNNDLSGRTYPFEGAAVILPQIAPYTAPLEILICGGSNPGAAIALDNCITIAPDTPNANWTLERMPSKRVMPCIAALPDGTYLIANGAHQGNAGFGLASDPNLNAVLYDPSKSVGHRMTVLANTTVARLYHSEAVLLDDGRVLISGSDPEDNTHPQEYRNEVFIPPYLMGNPARPRFNLTNIDWAYSQSVTLSILAAGAGGAYKVSLMGAVSSTHGNSMGQRTFFLQTSCSGSTCTVQAPPNANVCPPGWFQLFLLDGKGVPSTAIWVRVGGDPARLGEWPDAAGFDLPGMGPVERLF